MSQHPYNTRNHPTTNDVPSTSQPDKNMSSSKTPNHKETIPHLEYDFIEDLKKTRANISMYELMKFPAIQNQALQTITGGKNSKAKDMVVSNRTTVGKARDKSDAHSGNSQRSIQVTDELIGKKYSPLFLLTFEIFNKHVSNCMVDSGASTNVMPTTVAKKINAQIRRSNTKILQLDRTRVQVIGELKDTQIRLVSNPNVWQTIDIVVADIPEAYGLFLS